jgi:hypothetical protein
LRATPEQLCDALGACTDLKPVYRRLLKMALEQLQFLEQQIGQLDQELATLLHPHQDAVQRLAEVPGLGVDSAQQIIAEVGPTAATLPSGEQLSSWVGACPGEEESAGVVVFVGGGTLRRVGRLGEFGPVSKRVNPSLCEGGEGHKESEKNLREASALHATSAAAGTGDYTLRGTFKGELGLSSHDSIQFRVARLALQHRQCLLASVQIASYNSHSASFGPSAVRVNTETVCSGCREAGLVMTSTRTLGIGIGLVVLSVCWELDQT